MGLYKRTVTSVNIRTTTEEMETNEEERSSETREQIGRSNQSTEIRAETVMWVEQAPICTFLGPKESQEEPERDKDQERNSNGVQNGIQRNVGENRTINSSGVRGKEFECWSSGEDEMVGGRNSIFQLLTNDVRHTLKQKE